jgi:hypothetical protein
VGVAVNASSAPPSVKPPPSRTFPAGQVAVDVIVVPAGGKTPDETVVPATI